MPTGRRAAKRKRASMVTQGTHQGPTFRRLPGCVLPAEAKTLLTQIAPLAPYAISANQ